ncbi:MAG: sodium:solute symporter family transporter [Caulobacteraceae bacterium]
MNTAIPIFVLVILMTLGITWWASRKAKSRSDYYAAGGNITGVQNGLAIAGDFMSATTFLGMTGMFFTSGVDPTAIYYLCPLVGMSMMMLLVAGPLRRAGKFTLGDVMASRSGSPSLRLFAGVSTITVSIIYLVGQLVGAGSLISLLFGLNYAVSVILVGLLMVVYVAGGGMLAATWVQIIKAVMLIGIVAVIGALCVAKAGSIAGVYALAAQAHPLGASGLFIPGAGHTDMFSAVSLAFGTSVGLMGLPHLLIRFFTVPDVKTAKRSAVAATTIIGSVFVVMFGIVGPAAVAFMRGDPAFVGQGGMVAGGPNMVAIQLAKALGGPLLMGITSAVAFATILAVVSGLVMATASAASHDVYGVLRGKDRSQGEGRELTVFRLAAVAAGVVAITLAFAFQQQNVAFMTALAMGVAVSANVPVVLLTLYWRGLTTAGALTGGLFGLVTSVVLIVLGPAVWVKVLHHAAPIFPSDYPGLLVMPAAFAVTVAVSLATRSSASAPAAQPAQ